MIDWTIVVVVPHALVAVTTILKLEVAVYEMDVFVPVFGEKETPAEPRKPQLYVTPLSMVDDIEIVFVVLVPMHIGVTFEVVVTVEGKVQPSL